jgi:arabinofuranan 3-O-arabinosyltransferase
VSARRFLILCVVVVILVAAGRAYRAIETPGSGMDFAPLRGSAVALVHGHSVYAVPDFVYPPTAPIALLPSSIGAYRTALDAWLMASVVAVALATYLAVRQVGSGIRGAILGVIGAGVVIASDAVRDSLWLGNLSFLLAPIAVGVLLLFERGRWREGNALLFLSLLVKPLLAPLLLVPILNRRWRPLLEAFLAALVLLVLAVLLVPGGWHFFSVLRYVVGGSTLTGKLAVYNISIAGLTERLGVSGIGVGVRIVIGALALGVVVRWVRSPRERGDMAALGAYVLLSTFLVSSLSEDHYLLVMLPCVLLAAAFRGATDLLLVLPGLVVLALPRLVFGSPWNTPSALQVRYFVAEVLLVVTTLVFLVRRKGAPEPAHVPKGLA